MSLVNMTTAAPLAGPNAPVPYLNVVWAVSSLICQFTTIATMSFLLYCAQAKSNRLKVSNLSNSMLVYLVFHITFCALSLIYHVPVFMKFFSATNQIKIGRQLMYYISLPVGLYYYASPLPVLFITIDRCFVLTYPFHYNKRARKYFHFLTIFTIVFVSCINFTAFILTPQSDEDKARCSPIQCFLLNYRSFIQNNVKLFIGIANILCTCYFLKALKLGNNRCVKNRIVKVTLFMELFFNVSLSIITTLVIKFANAIPETYLGQYPLVPITLDTTICGLYYLRVMLNRTRSSEDEPRKDTKTNLKNITNMVKSY